LAVLDGRERGRGFPAIGAGTRVLASEPVQSRSRLAAIAVLAVTAQLMVGALAQLGFVVCVGRDHTAIERASADDCCAAHEASGRTALAQIERDCCSDVPLGTAVRSLSDVPRSPGHVVAVLPIVARVADLQAQRAFASSVAAPSSPDGVSRSVVLRV
jgi:hypothetical protein